MDIVVGGGERKGDQLRPSYLMGVSWFLDLVLNSGFFFSLILFGYGWREEC